MQAQVKEGFVYRRYHLPPQVAARLQIQQPLWSTAVDNRFVFGLQEYPSGYTTYPLSVQYEDMEPSFVKLAAVISPVHWCSDWAVRPCPE